MREQYYVATPTIILYSQDVPPPSENPESAPVTLVNTLYLPKKKTIKRLLCYRILHFRQYIVCIPISTQLAVDNALQKLSKVEIFIDLKVGKNGK